MNFGELSQFFVKTALYFTQDHFLILFVYYQPEIQQLHYAAHISEYQ